MTTLKQVEDEEAKAEAMSQKCLRRIIIRYVFSRSQYSLAVKMVLFTVIIEFRTSVKDTMLTLPMCTAGGL